MVLPTPEQKNNPPDVSRYGVTFPVVMTMGAFMTVALYNAIELHFLLFSTFKRNGAVYISGVYSLAYGAL
jgi:ABC-type multidrug transport system permease subunit